VNANTVTSSLRDLRKLPAVRRQTGKSAAAIYREAKAGTFPAPVKIGSRASAWVGSEVDAWISERIAQRDAAQRDAP